MVVSRVAVALGVIMGVLAYAPASSAANPQCQAVKYAQVGGQYPASGGSMEGIRAPILIRTDGNLCQTASPPNDDFEASWIALEQVNGSGITQIGFEHDWASPTSSHYCRFFATGDGVAHDYDCGSAFQTNGNNVFFRITQYSLPGGGINYDVADCGKEGDFNNCTQKDGSQAAYTNGAFAAVIQETPHACLSQILGSNSNPVNFGNSNWGTVGMSSSGQWDIRTWTDGSNGASCPNNYNSSISGDIISSWDSRNTS